MTKDYNVNSSTNKIDFEYWTKREAIFERYRANGLNPYARDPSNMGKDASGAFKDTQFSYVNRNESDKGKPSNLQLYSIMADASYVESPTGTDFTLLYGWGQRPITGNNASTTNTIIAYLSNNNENTTCTIKNTTAAKEAEKFFNAVDNIQVGFSPNIVRPDNNWFVVKNKENLKKTELLPNDAQHNDDCTVKHDGVLSDRELLIALKGYVSDVKALLVKASWGEISAEERERLPAARTIDIDDSDPYYKFFAKVKKLNNGQITLKGLTNAMEAISVQNPDGSLSFNHTLLDVYLNKEPGT